MNVIIAAILLVDERQKNSILKFEPYAHESNEATGEFAYICERMRFKRHQYW